MPISLRKTRSLAISAAVMLATAALAAVSLAIASPAANAGSVSQSVAPGKVRVRIAGMNNGTEPTDGSVAGTGHFTASGAITDKGKTVAYRTVKGDIITLRFVNAGRKGSVTFLVKINTVLGISRWTISAGTRAYKGLHGKGIESENADYTVSTLTGTVWR